MPRESRGKKNYDRDDRVREALKHCGSEPVTLNMKHEETVRRFIERLEDVYRKSRENPVWLGVGPDPRKKKETPN